MSENHLIGTYEITEKIGSGGMATVYKAYQPRVGRYVALKVLHQMFLDDKNFVARFQREAKIAGQLDHPNIVPIYDYDVDNQQPYLVMKQIEGQTLKDRMRETPLTLDEVRHVMGSICDALTYAHQQGVLHRDIKPSNIMIASDNTVYLTDFGLARIVHQGESTLSVDTMLGTPHYISPEQAQSQPVDGRTDIYAVGIILYELMTGRLPFTGDSAFAIVHQQIFSAPPLPAQLNPDIHPAVEAVLLKVLSKDPADRYATAQELYQAFDGALQKSGMYVLDASRVQRAEARAQSISQHTPKGGRYQPAPEAVQSKTERVFVNHDGSKSVIVPVLSEDAVLPDLTIKDWLDVVIHRIQDMADDLRQQSRERSLQQHADDVYYGIEGQVKNAIKVAQPYINGEMTTRTPASGKLKRDVFDGMDDDYDDHSETVPYIGRQNVIPVDLSDIDAREDKKRRRGILPQQILFFSHFTIFLFVVLTLFISQNLISNYVIEIVNEISIDIANEINQSPEQVSLALGQLANIPFWLVVAVGWGSGVITHGLNFLDNTLDFRHQQRKQRLDHRMGHIFGADWRNVASPQVYHQIRKKVNKRSKRRAVFWGHFISTILSILTLIALKPLIDPIVLNTVSTFGETMVHWASFILVFMLISIGIHAVIYLIENILDNDRREIKIQETIQQELYSSPQDTKRKNALDNYSPIRLSEDGEFTDSFIQETQKDDHVKASRL